MAKEFDDNEIIKAIAETKVNVEWLRKAIEGNGSLGVLERLTKLELWQAKLIGIALGASTIVAVIFHLVELIF